MSQKVSPPPPVRLARRSFLRSALLALLLHCSSLGPWAQAPETTIKAVFIYNFLQFVEWPETAFMSPSDPFVIGILGQDPFGSVLPEVVQGESIRGRSIVVRRYAKVEEARNCHILFISPSEAPRLKELLQALRKRSILTVGDMPGFVERGGMVGFFRKENKVRFSVNLNAAREAELNLSSKLLRVAEVYPHAPGQP